MQTFLLSTDFEQSAKWLDNQRLGKQRVECLQILKALTDSSYGWQHHPAVNMWRGYEKKLHRYGVEVCVEWIRRGYKDTCLSKLGIMYSSHINKLEHISPDWLTEELASNHRSCMLGKVHQVFANKMIDHQIKENKKSLNQLNKAQKVLEWYQSLGWSEQPAEMVKVNNRMVWPYIWPKGVE